MKERSALLKESNEVWGALMKGEEFDKEVWVRFYTEMALDIKREKERIGGNFAVAHVILYRWTRDLIRLPEP